MTRTIADLLIFTGQVKKQTIFEIPSANTVVVMRLSESYGGVILAPETGGELPVILEVMMQGRVAIVY